MDGKIDDIMVEAESLMTGMEVAKYGDEAVEVVVLDNESAYLLKGRQAYDMGTGVNPTSVSLAYARMTGKQASFELVDAVTKAVIAILRDGWEWNDSDELGEYLAEIRA